jgi:hypothetical protein
VVAVETIILRNIKIHQQVVGTVEVVVTALVVAAAELLIFVEERA